MGDNEDEEGVGHAGEGEFDASSDLSWVEVAEARDLCGGVSVAVHREDE